MSYRVVAGPKVYLVGRQVVDDAELRRFLDDEGVETWETDTEVGGEKLIEIGGRLCFDDQTEALTPWGWRRFSEICEDTPVATMNPETRAFEFQLPNAYHVYDYDGELLTFDGRDVSFSVTPEHRQYASPTQKPGWSDWGFHRTDELLKRRGFRVATAPASWSGSVPERIHQPAVRYTQVISNQTHSNIKVAEKASAPFVIEGREQVLALARLTAHYVANGSIQDQKGSGRGIVIYGRESPEIQSLASAIGLRSNVWVDKRNGCPRTCISGGMAVAAYFEHACGRGAANKKLPGWVLGLPAEHLSEIWDILVKTDGHRYEGGREVFITGSVAMSDQAQEILAKIGKSSSLTLAQGTNGPCFRVTRKTGRPAFVESSRVQNTPYCGKVYCVTTDNGIVYVRRNGRVHFSANCYMSFSKPRPGGNASYIEHIKEVGHFSVVEHQVLNILITGVSRALTHELVRTRVGMSPSQLSQRFVDEGGGEGKPLDVLLPPLVRDAIDRSRIDLTAEQVIDSGAITLDAEIASVFHEAMEHASAAYRKLDDLLAKRLAMPDLAPRYPSRTARRKAAREAARSVLPNATETKVMTTWNTRALRHFIALRGTREADAEIRALALSLLDLARHESPNCFCDFVVKEENGVKYVETPYSGR